MDTATPLASRDDTSILLTVYYEIFSTKSNFPVKRKDLYIECKGLCSSHSKFPHWVTVRTLFLLQLDKRVYYGKGPFRASEVPVLPTR
jgi:hypothetical protein